MTKRMSTLLAGMALAACCLGAVQAAELTMYQYPGFGGNQLVLRGHTANIMAMGFNDQASSIVVDSGRWEVCTDVDFKGFCAVLTRGEYSSLDARLNNRISSAREVGSYSSQTGPYRNYGRGSIQLFAQPGMRGQARTLETDAANLQGSGFNDRAASVVVTQGTWQLCADANYGGTCRTYAPGRYADLGFGMSKEVSSVRLVRAYREAPAVVSSGMGEPMIPGPEGTARAILFNDGGLRGSSMAVSGPVVDLRPSGFDGQTASILVEGGTWQFCSEAYFGGLCRVMGPGRYPGLTDMGLDHRISSIRPVVAQAIPAAAAAPIRGAPDVAMSGVGIELFEAQNFTGPRFATSSDRTNLNRTDMNDRASSLVVYSGQWEVCTDTNYAGRCVVFREGRYPNLGGLANQISSVRRID